MAALKARPSRFRLYYVRGIAGFDEVARRSDEPCIVCTIRRC